MLEILMRYLHFVGIFVLAATSLTQIVLIASEMPNNQVRQVINLGRVNSAAAIVVIGAGLSLWFWVGKPSEFYSGSYVFYAKLAIFLAAGALTAIPGAFFRIAATNSDQIIKVPPKVILMKRLEIVGLLILPLLAVIMARGIGHG